MMAFLLRVWGLARPYRGRLLLGVLTGVVGGFMEPLMIATITLVYGLIFPDANALPLSQKGPARFSAEEFVDLRSLTRKLKQPGRPVDAWLVGELSAATSTALENYWRAGSDPASLRAALVEDLNTLIRGPSSYDARRFAGVVLRPETRRLLSQNPQGDQLVRLNRLLLENAYPRELSKKSATLSSMPAWAQEWLAAAEEALHTGVQKHPAAVAALVALIPLVILLRGVFSYLNIYFLQWAAIRAITDLRTRLFEHLMNLSAGFFGQSQTGELMSRIMNDTGALQNIISNATAVMVKDPVTLITLMAYALWQQPKLTLISMVVMPLCMIPIVVYSRKVRRSSRALQTHSAELGNVMSESFSGNRIIKAYNLEDTVVRQFRSTAAKFIGHYMRIVRSMEIPGPLLEFVGALGVSLVLLYLVLQGGARPNSAGFLTVILVVYSMYRPLKNLTRLHNNLEQARAASERVFELLATQTTVREPLSPKPLRAAGATIHFDAVDFAYGEKAVLHGVQFQIRPGQLVALVGPSGSGKSTLLSLLLRFYDPLRGAIRLGGTNIRDVPTRELRSQIAVVTQETVLFNDTIRYNIALGRPGASEADVVDAARHAHAHEFILEKPLGYDSVIGEKGVNLSGGQRQRLAIARAVLKNAPILILDEATSSLDTESERAVQAALTDLMVGRTTLCVAHRLSTVRDADVIVVLDGGKIVATGTHGELLQQDGLYRRLYELQFQPEALAAVREAG